ncbi:hypothetical protein SCLCIDRAFT_1210361 [Scleroderma citrinum Foug A]|uniref:Uncharacterized protein n=1 Tax=Scleroderma citrinum Foug A TaxID=1036808 RepID=A0A0C3E3C9_9AGAM|nr:hypothetical protein SCLCIDRAFT_1210361 [Scleroderma citrinum Foug A]
MYIGVLELFIAGSVPPMSLPSKPLDEIQLLIYDFDTKPVVHFDGNIGYITLHSELASMIPDATSFGINIPHNDKGNVRHIDEGCINQGQVEPPRQADREQFKTLSEESKDRDYEFACEILEGGHPCGHSMTFNSCKEHVAEFHSIPKSGSVSCPWASCTKASSRKNLDRHIKTKHLGFKRLIRPKEGARPAV